jgi:AraC family transcriptional regulator of adaptative response/methylated-DNA-[protein]-cysteine methyltransferase
MRRIAILGATRYHRAMTFPTLTDAQRWQAVLTRDRALEGAFVYAVRSTGIYCRASCPSRRPRPTQVEFFPVPAAAEQAGYRACRRCHPLEVRRDPQVALAERACRVMDASAERPTLATLGQALRVSPAHLQRIFTLVTGISPRAWHEARRAGRLREALRSGRGVSGALYAAGYGSPSRIYERRSATIGMTPATYRKGGAGMTIRYSTADSPLGRVLAGATDRGLCFVGLGNSDASLERALATEFPRAERARDDRGLGRMVRQVVERVRGRRPHGDLPLDIQATAFQRLVWDELTRIPLGDTVSYAEVARRVGRPKAVRAVAAACAGNPVAVVIPCHRVVRSDGGLGGYRWGVGRKAALLNAEGGKGR